MNDPVRDAEWEQERAKLEAHMLEIRARRANEPPPVDNVPSSWVSAVAPDAVSLFQKRQRESEEHAASCSDTPCERCQRYLCPCGQPAESWRLCNACRSTERLAARLKVTRASVPARFEWSLGVTPDFLATRVRGTVDLVRRALEAPPSRSLLFLGPTGSGKTSLAVAMLDVWARKADKPGAIFVEAAWLARARARHKLGQGDPPLVEQAMSAPLLLLDDLGQEREDRDGCITDVVYERHNAQLPTWVTCGLANGDESTFGEHLSRRYDGGFVRRVLETGKPIRLGAR